LRDINKQRIRLWRTLQKKSKENTSRGASVTDGKLLVDAAQLVIAERSQLRSAWQSFKAYLKRGKIKFLVVGAGGTGKSTLGAHMQRDDPFESVNYIESLTTEKYELPNVPFNEIIVPPGQGLDGRRMEQQPHLNKLATGDIDGVINVASWGCHSMRELAMKDHKVYVDGMSKEDFLQAYLAHNRDVEVARLKELLPYLQGSKGNLWMITLVTKQDLWWNDRSQVGEFYKAGGYNDLVVEITKAKGDNHFSHSLHFASLVMQNLVVEDGTVLMNTTAGYDVVKQLSFRQKFDEEFMRRVVG
jgi:hypothetical protein